jgi:hypothetical protein
VGGVRENRDRNSFPKRIKENGTHEDKNGQGECDYEPETASERCAPLNGIAIYPQKDPYS